MSSLTTAFASLLDTVHRPGDFFVTGTTTFLPPLLEVAGVGQIALPLLPAQAEQLISVTEAAPFGRGEQTIIDPSVRRCRQISADRVRLGGKHWAAVLETILARVAEGFGIKDPITAEFYKLLIYDRGSFFIDHRDTEKTPGMFATLVIVLPGEFAGGALIVRHKNHEVCLKLHCEDPAEVAFAAFYADCVHEVLPITGGYRLTLAYNVIRPKKARRLDTPDYDTEQTRIAALLQSWRAEKARKDDTTPEKLVYPLEHAYTPAELDFSTLKGRDAAVAGVLANVAAQANYDLRLALLTIEESGAAECMEYTGYRSRRDRWQDEDEFEAGEVFERSVNLSDWRSSNGQAIALNTIPVGENEFSPPGACDAFTPDEEHFHEATGNEGASFERSYRRAALVLWQNERTFAILSQAGLSATLPYLTDLVQRWNANRSQTSLQHEARDLAAHMLTQWPQRWYMRHDKGPSDVAKMLVLLSRLDDETAIERCLKDIIAADIYEPGDNVAIIGAVDRLPAARRIELIEVIIAGTAAKTFGACADLLARAADTWSADHVGHLVNAATLLLDALPADPAHGKQSISWKPGSTVDPTFIINLLTGLGAIDTTLTERAVMHFIAWPKTYDPDTILIPAARKLLGTNTIQHSAALEHLRTVCLTHLQTRIAKPLQPPADWRRPNAVTCRCADCTELAHFLDDPTRASWVYKAVEFKRKHVEEITERAKADIDMKTDTAGRPYSLVCTKNQASYERLAKQRASDLENYAALMSEHPHGTRQQVLSSSS